jgi:hypothetical protein
MDFIWMYAISLPKRGGNRACPAPGEEEVGDHVAEALVAVLATKRE